MSMVDISTTERRIAERIDAGVTQTLAVSDAGAGVAFSNVGEMMEFAKMMAVANSGVRKHLRGNSGACLAILTQALEWGLSPYQVANKSYFVSDQIAFESQLVQAVILKRAPIRGRIKFEFMGEGQDRACRAWARLREDDEVVDYTSPAIKDIKVKNSPLWVGDPDQQLAYFSGRSLCRRHFPDVLLGIYAEDEFVGATPAIGPERARDVSPPKSLSGKLDALARTPARSADLVTDHAKLPADPTDDAGPHRNPEDAGTGQSSPSSDTTRTPRDEVYAEVHAGIEDGKDLNVLLNQLGDLRDSLTNDDVKRLREAAKVLKAQGSAA